MKPYAVAALLAVLSVSLGGTEGMARRQFASPAAPTAPPLDISTSDAPVDNATTAMVPADATNITITDAPDMMNSTDSGSGDNSTMVPPVVTATDLPDANTTLQVPVANATNPSTTPDDSSITDIITVITTATPDENTTSTPSTTTTTTAPTPTPTVVDCKSKEQPDYAKVRAFTALDTFRSLTESEQIFVYEILAAGEGCNMIGYINPETTQRMFRLLLDLPLRFVPTFTRFVSTSLTLEGVIVPE